jgi:hypothetical protein
MELMVASWTIRIALFAALAVGAASYAGGTSAIVSVDRGMAAAVLFTFAGRWLLGWLEPPERRLLRMRRKRDARRAKAARTAGSGHRQESGGSVARQQQPAAAPVTEA